MPNDNEVLLHNIIDSVQSSIDIADKASRKKYNFALAQMKIKMTLNFELKQDVSKQHAPNSKPRHWFSLFSRKHGSTLTTTSDDTADRHASMTLDMLFKPGGKALQSITSVAPEDVDASDSDGDDTDTDDDSTSDDSTSDDTSSEASSTDSSGDNTSDSDDY